MKIENRSTDEVRRSSKHRFLPFVLIAIVGVVIGSGLTYFADRRGSLSEVDVRPTSEDGGRVQQRDAAMNQVADVSSLIELPQSQWKTSGIRLQTAERRPFVEEVRLTGKVSLNLDRTAHIYPIVEGIADQVLVGIGQQVKASELLLVVHSREIGQAKLDLYQARLQEELATTKHTLQQEIHTNALSMLKELRNGTPITDIETQFRSRTIGDYRERLLTAYANFLKSEADVQRLAGPTADGVIPQKQLYAAQSSRNADQAAFQARVEQMEYELETMVLLSSQNVKEASTRVAVAATNLRILGCDEEDIQSIDPEKQGASISDFSIRAPFDGTVISKDVALKEQVRPTDQILSISDLSTVWITADIYEQDVPLLDSFRGRTVQVHNQAWPDKSFEATVFHTGEIMDVQTRTISLRALAQNRERLLKPGMFVHIVLQSTSKHELLQVPVTAVQEHENAHFLFIHRDNEHFERRPVTVGKSNTASVVIEDGISGGESIVIEGGFVLKSKMLAELME